VVHVTASNPDRQRFIHRIGLAVLIIGVTLAAFGLLVVASQVALLAFAAILFAIFLDALASWVTRHLPVPHGVALALVIVAAMGLATGLGFLVGPPLYEQFVQLSRELPSAGRALVEDIGSQKLFQSFPPLSEIMTNSRLLGGVADVFTTVIAALAGALFLVVVGVFVAARPHAYIDPAVRLLPPPRRPAARQLLETIGSNLRHWLVARFISMFAIGVLTAIGLWIAGVPAWASLGLLAGVLSFIPNFGPILSALPGILLGLSQSPMTAVWAAVVYAGVQAVEGNVITPYAEQRAVALPAGFLLTVQLLLGLLAGILGMLVATPLCVVAVLAARELHVRRMEADVERRPTAPHLRADAQASGAS
jgi:predicted PurR-regulated permease PerM